jgi:hypothetical protein
MFTVSKYPLGAYFGPQPSIPCVGRAPMPIARMAASTALPSHCRAIWASQMPRSPQGHHIQGPPVPTPHADETHPEHRSRSRFGFSGSRTAQNPNPTRRNKLRRREDHQEDCPRMQVPSSRCVEPIAWPCSTGLRLPRADRISSIVNHFRQFLISSAEVRNIRSGSVTSVSFRAAGLRSKVQRRLQWRSALPTLPSSNNHCIPE